MHICVLRPSLCLAPKLPPQFFFPTRTHFWSTNQPKKCSFCLYTDMHLSTRALHIWIPLFPHDCMHMYTLYLVLLVCWGRWSEGGMLIFPRGASGFSWWWISILSSRPPTLEVGTRGSKFISLTSTGRCEWVESDAGGVACEKSTPCMEN